MKDEQVLKSILAVLERTEVTVNRYAQKDAENYGLSSPRAKRRRLDDKIAET